MSNDFNQTEALRASRERVLALQLTLDCERKQHRTKLMELAQALTTLRWWAVALLFWVGKEALDPGRFAAGYTGSWAYKLATLSGHPQLVVAWFVTCAALVVPLVVAMAVAPASKACRCAQYPAMLGLFGGGGAFVFMATMAMRLDAPQVTDSYSWSAVMLTGTGLLVACLHNSRQVRAVKEKQIEQSTCAEPAL